MTFLQVYKSLFSHYGPQHWWPGDSPFEVMVGAILTQNTAWTNVERAIANLKAISSLTPQSIIGLPVSELAVCLKPSGYFNVKAQRLRNFCQWYVDNGKFESLSRFDTTTLRRHLLAINGIGPETADDMLLYAFERPVFVIDAYTRRLFSRLAVIDAAEGYETLRHRFEAALTPDAALFNEYHALIVCHAKAVCKKRPACTICCLAGRCPAREL